MNVNEMEVVYLEKRSITDYGKHLLYLKMWSELQMRTSHARYIHIKLKSFA